MYLAMYGAWTPSRNVVGFYISCDGDCDYNYNYNFRGQIVGARSHVLPIYLPTYLPEM